MKRKMLKRAAALVILSLLLSSCSGGNGGRKKEPEQEAIVTVTATPTVSPSAGQLPTVSPTEAVTPMPEPDRGHKTAEAIIRNRELHEIIRPKREVSPVGTGHVSEAEEKRKKYGLTVHYYNVYVQAVELFTKETANNDTQFRSICISGLTNKEAERKINARIEEIAMAMADYDYIPDVAGILNLVDKYGEPEKKVSAELRYAGIGYLEVDIDKSWLFKETKTLHNFDELLEHLSTHEDFRGYRSNYVIVDKDKDAGTITWEITYFVEGGTTVIFNMVTGEEPALSDFFPEGEDYLTYLNDLITERLKYDYWTGEWSDDNYDATREYDGTTVFSGITGDEPISLSVGWSSYDERYGGSFRVGDYEVWVPEVLIPAEGAVDACEECFFFAYAVGNLKVDESGNPDSAEDIRIQTGDAGEVSIALRCGDGGLFTPKDESWVWNEYWPPMTVTKEELTEAVREYFTENWPSVMNGGEKCKAEVSRCVVYPNGYIFISLEFDCGDGPFCYDGAQFWMKDGKYVPTEELFTISVEELLKRMLLSSGDGLSEDKAARAAEMLVPYIDSVRFTPDDIEGGIWSNRFVLTEEAGYIGDKLWTQLSEYIPAEQLDQFFDGSLFARVNLIKYLRIYEGFYTEK